jgi:hypothetical protein
VTQLEIALTCVLTFAVLAGVSSFVITLLEVRRLWASFEELSKRDRDIGPVVARVELLEKEAGINPEWLRKT